MDSYPACSKQFSGHQLIQDLFAIEIFCGAGRLTASMRALGLNDSFGVDSKLPQSLKCAVLQLDLTKPDHFQLVHEYVQNPACCYCHFAPPCGTASRARLIQRRNQRNPPIVRTDQHPDGLPHLGTLAMRVQSIFRTNEPPTSLHSCISSRNFGASKIQAGPSCGKPKPFLL